MKNLFLFFSAIAFTTIAYGQCQANFTHTVNGGVATFVNSSVLSNPNSGNATWDYGDGSGYSINQSSYSPDNAYLAPGTYNVCLTVTINENGTICQNTFCDSVVITDTSGGCFTSSNAVSDAMGNINCSASGAYHYNWRIYDSNDSLLTVNGQSSFSFLAPNPGIYKVCVGGRTSPGYDACDTACFFVTVDSVANLKSLSSFHLPVFPNPTEGVVTANTSNTSIASLSILTTTGIKVFHQTVSSESTQLNLVDLPNGIYFIQANDQYGHTLVTSRVLKH